MGLTSSPGDSYHQRSWGNTEASSSLDAYRTESNTELIPSACMPLGMGRSLSVRQHTHLWKTRPIRLPLYAWTYLSYRTDCFSWVIRASLLGKELSEKMPQGEARHGNGEGLSSPGLGAGSQGQAGDMVLWPAPGGLQWAHQCTVCRHHGSTVRTLREAEC